MKCKECKGTGLYVGFIISSDCLKCNGSGQQTEVNAQSNAGVDTACYARLTVKSVYTKFDYNYWLWDESTNKWNGRNFMAITHGKSYRALGDKDVFVPGGFSKPSGPPAALVDLIPFRECKLWLGWFVFYDVQPQVAYWTGKSQTNVSHYYWNRGDAKWDNYTRNCVYLDPGDIFVPGNLPEPTSPPYFKDGLPSCNKVDW